MLFTMLEVLVLSQPLEDANIEHQNLHKKACESMMVSYAGTDKGGKEFFFLYQYIIFEITSSDFGRGIVKFQNLGQLLEVKDSKKFMSMLAKMSCLVTLTRMSNGSEVSQMIDVVNEFKISKKHLIIFVKKLNTTLLRKKAITFNVIIHHNGPG